MKKELHPNNYRPVVFEDINNGYRFISRSTVATAETTKWDDGVEYPLVKIHISSASHPFFTGQEKLVDIEGRVDKFKARQEAAKAAADARAKAAKKASERKVSKADKDGKDEKAAPKADKKPAKATKEA
jgi:large subunit ribosomal protein L31